MLCVSVLVTVEYKFNICAKNTHCSGYISGAVLLFPLCLYKICVVCTFLTFLSFHRRFFVYNCIVISYQSPLQYSIVHRSNLVYINIDYNLKSSLNSITNAFLPMCVALCCCHDVIGVCDSIVFIRC